MSLLGLIKLIRPLNSLMIGFAVIVGAFITNRSSSFLLLSFGFLTGFLISSFSMVINDYFDLEVDKINMPNRPLVRGEVSPKEAVSLSIVLLISGLLFSALTGLFTFTIALIFSIISFLYNWKLKELGLLGNVMVSLSISIPFIYGCALVQRINMLILLMALTAFLAGIGREIIKGIVDIEGDEIRDVRSIARTKGSKKAALLGGVFFIAAVISSFLPMIFLDVSIYYMTLISIVDVMFIVLALRIIKDFSKENALKVKKRALYVMLLGLISYLTEGVLGG